MADWMMDTFFIFSGLAFVAFIAAWKAGHFQDWSGTAGIPLLVEEEDYYTPEWALDEEEWRDVDADRDTPQKGAGLLPLPSRPPRDRAPRPHLERDWLALAWLWGFAVVLALVLLWWLCSTGRRGRSGDLPGGQLERLHERARRPGLALLHPAERESSSARDRADRRPPRERQIF